MREQQEDRGVDLRQVLTILRRQIWVILACPVLAVGIAVALSLHQPKEYTADASLLFRDPGFGQTLFGSDAAPSPNAQREAQTNFQLVSLPVVAQRTAEKLGQGLTPASVRSAVKISSENDSDVVKIDATAKSPHLAADIANTFGNEYIAFRRDSDRAKISAARRTVEQQLRALRRQPGLDGATGGSSDNSRNNASTSAQDRLQNLQGRAGDLRILASLQTGNAELVQPATPSTSPSAPKPRRNGLIALFGGLIFGLGLALLREQLDRRVKDPEELGDVLGAPLVGVIPRGRGLGAPAPMPHALSAPEAESFRMLHAQLRLSQGVQHDDVLIITSSRPADGKSTVALNLAATAASYGERVLLLEADIRRPSLGHLMKLDPGPGLTDFLIGRGDNVDEFVRQVPVEGPNHSEGHLSVLLAGSIPTFPAGLINSPRFGALVEQARERYDRVVIDTSPAGVVSDPLTLMQRVKGMVLVVGRVGGVTTDDLSRLRRQMSTSGAGIDGVIANLVPTSGDGGGYYYTYEPRRNGRGSPPEGELPPTEHAGVGSR